MMYTYSKNKFVALANDFVSDHYICMTDYPAYANSNNVVLAIQFCGSLVYLSISFL